MSSPRRVAYVLKIFPKISETFIAGELAELRARGVELRILSLLPPRDEPRHDIIQHAGLDKLVSYDPAGFSQIVREFRPELLHAHFATESTATARELAQEHRLPFTFTAHGYDIFRKPPPDFAARAAAAAAVVTVSKANAAYIGSAFGVPAGRVRVIPCGVDTRLFSPNGAAPPGRPLILCVARQVVVKNLGLLLQACAQLRDRGVSFRCVLVGDGPCRAELAAAQSRLGLESIVEMVGAVDQGQVLRYWQQAALGVLTSDNEGMPVCLMEAAACGVPVVATDVGGVRELVKHGATGLLVRSRDASALASRLEQLLGNPKLRTQMGRLARARAEEQFSVARQVQKLLDLWTEVLGQSSR